MKKRLFRLGALCCVAAMTITTGAQALSVEEAYDILQRSYVDKLPRAAQDAKSLDELFSYTDDYTYYMTAEEYQAFLQGVEGDVSFAGIGAALCSSDYDERPFDDVLERLEQPGGNVDYERFLAEVLEPLRAGKDCSYRPYDCKQQKLTEPVAVRQGNLIVVEGSYSCHPTLWERYDLHVFLTVNPQEQLRRIERRNGPQGLEMFRQRWIPLEERYFSACRVEERCELRLSSGE